MTSAVQRVHREFYVRVIWGQVLVKVLAVLNRSRRLRASPRESCVVCKREQFQFGTTIKLALVEWRGATRARIHGWAGYFSSSPFRSVNFRGNEIAYP
jgi:hypothetical protein